MPRRSRRSASQRSRASSKRKEKRKIAASQVSKLVRMSMATAPKDPTLAKRYAEIARAISSRFNIRSVERRRLYCRFCKAFALPGALRYRLSKKRKSLNVTCSNCGKTYRKMLG